MPDEGVDAPPDVSEAVDPDDEITLARQFAHDVRSPISALVVLSSSLREQLGEFEGVPRYHLELLYNAALSLDALMSDLSDLGRVDGLAGPWSRSAFSLDELVHDVRNLLLPAAQLRNVRIDVRSDEPDRRIGHLGAIRRALLGLAALPLRAGGAGPVRISARRPADREEDEIAFTVRTEESGPESEVLDAVQAVARGDRARDRTCFGHLGLELTIRLLEAMETRLTTETHRGTAVAMTFRLRLPPADPLA